MSHHDPAPFLFDLSDPDPKRINPDGPTPAPDKPPAPEKPAPRKAARIPLQAGGDLELLGGNGAPKPAEAFAALAQGMAPYLRISPEQISEAVRDEMIRRGIQSQLRIIREEAVVGTIQGFRHRQLPEILAVLSRGYHAYLWGAPGGGKTTLAAQLAEALGRQFGYISVNEQTPEWRLTGLVDAHGRYHATGFRRCYEEGGLFLFDEADNASGNLLTTLNSALDNGICAFPDNPVRMSPKFALIASGNTTWRGGTRGHTARRAADSATLERFIFIKMEYDEELELALALRINPQAEPWVAWVRKVRAYAEVNVKDLVASPRASLRLADLSMAGAFPTRDAMVESILFKGLQDDTRTGVLKACPIPESACFKALAPPEAVP